MGRQAKLKALRRTARALKRLAEEEEKQKAQAAPPDLGVYASETVETADKFGG